MREVFVLNGKWWTPATPHHVTEGEMTFDPSKGAILKLSGLLDESETCAMPFEIVLGDTENGIAVTMIGSNGIWLTRPYRAADAGESDMPACSSLCANVLLVGRHYLSPKEIDFQGFDIDLSHLSDWVGLNNPRCTDQHQSTAVAPPHDIGQLGKLIIEPGDGNSCHLVLRFGGAVDLDKGIELVRQLRNLMSLLMHRSVQVLRVRGAVGGGADNIQSGMMVDIFYPSFAQDRSASPLEPEDMLLPLCNIREELGSIVAKWFSANETMAQVLDLYFAASHSAELFPETRFLMYVQALEAYHRLRYRNFELDPKEHAERLAVIIASIPEQYREWMRDGLEHSNEPSHGQRLKEVYRDLSDIMDEFVEDKKRFVHQVIKTRNQMTHLEGDSMVLEGKDLALATTRLRLLLELCLLSEIGIGPEKMKQAVMNNAMFSRIRVQSDDTDKA